MSLDSETPETPQSHVRWSFACLLHAVSATINFLSHKVIATRSGLIGYLLFVATIALGFYWNNAQTSKYAELADRTARITAQLSRDEIIQKKQFKEFALASAEERFNLCETERAFVRAVVKHSEERKKVEQSVPLPKIEGDARTKRVKQIVQAHNDFVAIGERLGSCKDPRMEAVR